MCIYVQSIIIDHLRTQTLSGVQARHTCVFVEVEVRNYVVSSRGRIVSTPGNL
jgi:hypothetical protein